VSGARIGIVDYGMGNRRSVEKALEHVGAAAVISSDPRALSEADGLVLPGVGAFPAAMARLRALELDDFVRERAAAGAPLLGICLGMQLLFDSTTELGGAEGLGLLGGSVARLDAAGLRLPHIGWNLVTWQRPSALTSGLAPARAFYHVHTFAAVPSDPADVLGEADYGGPFASAVAREPVFGVQFHPEKSSADGLALLENFTAICARVAA
jgi:imidazole glycerol-phosphate synthase subunit HisH